MYNNAMTLDRKNLIQHFGDIWFVHHSGFTTVLSLCRKHFDGDLDHLLIMCVIAGRTLSANRVRGVSYEEFLEGRRGGRQGSGTNVHSIADSTGIPRETVRRKVERLIERGWVERKENRHLVVTDKAAAELRPITEATFDYIADLVNATVDSAATASEYPGAGNT
jgi:hypothetical protein